MPPRRIPAITGGPGGNQTGPENETNPPPRGQPHPDVMATIHQAVSEMLPGIIAQTVEALRQTGEDPNPPPGLEIRGRGTTTGGELVDIHQWLERFHKQKPRTFTSAITPVEVEDWISHLEKIFRVLGCSDRVRVELAAYKLEDDANRWWQAWKQSYGGDIEYATLRQKEDESVSEYVARFLRLASFAGSMAGTVENQVNKFKWTLNSKFRPKLINQQFSSVAQVADAARNIERERLDAILSRGDGGKKRSRDMFQGSSGGKGSIRTGQWKPADFKPQVSSQGTSSKGSSNTVSQPRCKDCGFKHRPGPCLRMIGACYNCGQRGHLARDCKQGPKDNAKDKEKQSTSGGRVFALSADKSTAAHNPQNEIQPIKCNYLMKPLLKILKQLFLKPPNRTEPLGRSELQAKPFPLTFPEEPATKKGNPQTGKLESLVSTNHKHMNSISQTTTQMRTRHAITNVLTNRNTPFHGDTFTSTTSPTLNSKSDLR
ncbi:hypothetical protein OSB04_027551 [Centaurea solstitialis]|uniref:CCHC-type domain-containing protein n=1 Tax=Centaurea solstitialis TaxID=347529 RepID=A0AA38SRJ5_9ASTR|nr:hypothetical protein OSB04_027551 [Centaurea solstitialis]